MDRRRFLALCGASTSLLAGCSTTPDTRGTDRTEVTDTSSVAPLDGAWAGYRHDAANTAATDDSGPTTEPVAVWSRATATGIPATAPAAADGAFVVVAESGALYAREAADGAIRWRAAQPVDPGVAPVMTGDTAVAADGATLIGWAIDDGDRRWTASLDATDGRERWRHDEAATPPPALADEYLFLGDETGRLHALGPQSN